MNAFQIKILACMLMVIDHTAFLFPSISLYMHWIGRVSVPLFIFMCAMSCHYTHNIRRYILRLYLFGIGVSFIQVIFLVDTNIITTFVNIAVIVYIFKQQDLQSIIKSLVLYCLYQCVVYVLLLFLSSTAVSDRMMAFLIALTGTLFSLEGGWCYVILGVVMWVTRNDMRKLTACYVVFCILYACISRYAGPLFWRCASSSISPSVCMMLFNQIQSFGVSVPESGQSMIFVNYQWMMVFAAPIMLLYNRQRGLGCKWFFYIFYPLHIVILQLIS